MENVKKSTRDRELLLSRTLNAPVALVWEVWTRAEHIVNWWGPDGFTNTINHMDFRPGGEWDLIMHGPDGMDYKNKSIFREIVRHKKIVYDHVSSPRFTASIGFEEQGEQTIITWHMLFESAEEFIRTVKTFRADEGLKQNLEKLGRYLAHDLAGVNNNMPKNFRQGAIGALLDEYERAISELKKTVEDISDAALALIVDAQTADENCRSVQTILTHLLHSGYGYAISIHNLKGQRMERPAKILRTTIGEYIADLSAVFSFTENILGEFKDNELEGPDDSLKIKSGWGPIYDIEQMAEHAIVHILRHRRQIERLKPSLRY